MATETVTATGVTTPPSPPPNREGGIYTSGILRCAGTTVEATAKDAGSVYRICLVPWSARIFQVWFACDDLGTTATVNIGVSYDTSGSYAAVDADLFASAVDCNAAAVGWTNVTNESGVYTLADIAKPLWQAAGLGADPGGLAVLTVTSVGAIDAAGTISAYVLYTVP